MRKVKKTRKTKSVNSYANTTWRNDVSSAKDVTTHMNLQKKIRNGITEEINNYLENKDMIQIEKLGALVKKRKIRRKGAGRTEAVTRTT